MTSENKSEQGSELIPVSEIITSLNQVPEAFTSSQMSVQNAEKVGQDLLNIIQAEGMNPDLDLKANNFLLKSKTTLEFIQAKRKPFTSMMDQIRSQFVSLENRLDPKRPDSIASRIQAERDNFVKKLKEEEEKREEEKRKKIEREKALIEVRSKFELQLEDWFINGITATNQMMFKNFNSQTLESIDDFNSYLVKVTTEGLSFPEEKFQAINPEHTSSHLSLDEITEIKDQVKNSLKPKFAIKFQAIVKETASNLLERISGKKDELIRSKEAGKKERERIEAERMKREEEEAIRLKEAEEKMKAESLAKIEAEKASAITSAIFEAESQSAEVAVEVPKSKEGLEVNLKSSHGLVLLFQLWFENEGKNWTVEKLEKKFDFILKYASKHTQMTGEVIDSKLITYSQTVKAKIQK